MSTHPSTGVSASSITQKWTSFWFAPQLPWGLHILRACLGCVLIYWLWSMSGHIEEFFSYQGWLDQSTLADDVNQVDRLNWSMLHLIAHDPAKVTAFYWTSLAVLVLYTLGLFTRITSVLVYIIVVSFSANPLIELETEVFFRILTFYLMVGYLLIDWNRDDYSTLQKVLTPWQHSLWNMFSGKHAVVSTAATFSLRLLQVHVALAILSTGLHKLQMMEWWSGVAYWYPMHRPSMLSVDSLIDLRQRWPRYLAGVSLVTYLVVLWQLFFPYFAWRTGKWRVILLGGALAGTIGLMVIYPIPQFGPTFLLLCLAFIHGNEWGKWFGRFLPGNS